MKEKRYMEVLEKMIGKNQFYLGKKRILFDLTLCS